ncbi:DUF3298 and DUF4163 domain-containing protein [Intestinibacillus massiliensis]|nr:DUF3298 and DUF4163 domain-containing protein [Intestinibacillus massiliensis]
MNRCKTCFLTIGLLMAILVEGCAQPKTEQAPADVPQKAPEVITEEPEKQPEAEKEGVEQFELKDDTDGAVLLQVEVHKPQLAEYVDKGAYSNIKKYYDNLYAKERTWWKGELASFAQEDREARQQDGGGFEPYQVRENYEVTCNNDEFLSVRRTSDTYTGGAHGNQTVMGETFRKADGSQVMLGDLFTGEGYQETLFDIVRGQMVARGPYSQTGYYENADQLVADTFDPAAFYVTGDPALVLAYATYTLAPYAAGPQEFTIPFSELADILKPGYIEG